MSKIICSTIKLKLKSFDHRLLDKSVREIVELCRSHSADFSGPIPIPSQIIRKSNIKSVHVYRTSGEEFVLQSHCRLIRIYKYSSEFLTELNKVSVPAAVMVSVGVEHNKSQQESIKN